MATSLKEFAAECHRLLSENPGPEGRETVRQALEKALVDEAFVAENLGPDNDSPRKVLFEDPELGFCILAHVRTGADESKPHDHGPTWAIYGQAVGVTEMTDWRKLKPAEDGKPGVVEPVQTYPLKPGMAKVYNEGELHSPRREGETRLIRIEGQNMATVKRDCYEAVAAS